MEDPLWRILYGGSFMEDPLWRIPYGGYLMEDPLWRIPCIFFIKTLHLPVDIRRLADRCTCLEQAVLIF
jgi:hypothetical protein